MDMGMMLEPLYELIALGERHVAAAERAAAAQESLVLATELQARQLKKIGDCCVVYAAQHGPEALRGLLAECADKEVAAWHAKQRAEVEP